MKLIGRVPIASKKIFDLVAKIKEDTEVPEYDEFLMNIELYNRINNALEKNRIGSDETRIRQFVNRLIKSRPSLYRQWSAFHEIRIKLKKKENSDWIVNELLKHLENMEENKNFGLSVIKDRRGSGSSGSKSRTKKSENTHEYQEFFDILDENIKAIQELIILCVTPKKIVIELSGRVGGLRKLNMTIYYSWKDYTKYQNELKMAVKYSAAEYMHLSVEFMEDWLNKPFLEMKHSAIVREIGLYYSRMAGFLDQQKWGKKVEIIDDRPQNKVLDGRDLETFLAGLGDVAERERIKARSVQFSKDVEEDAEKEEEGFTEFEEM